MSELLFKPFPIHEIEVGIEDKIKAIPTGLSSPEYIRAKQEALRDFTSYGTRDLTGRPIPFDSSSKDYTAYVAALRAYEFLSKPLTAINGFGSDTTEAGRALLKILREQRASSSRELQVLLTPDEHVSLQRGNYSALEKPMAPQEQRQRMRLNECVRHSLSHEVNNLSMRYHALYDPARVERIEQIMQSDSTGSWLLKVMKQHQVPVVLYEYELPKDYDYRTSRVFLGRYIVTERRYVSAHGRSPAQRSDILEYMQLFVNNSRDVWLASAMTHEGRHCWQQHHVMPPMIYTRLSPMDVLVYGMLAECDAHAIQSKSNRNYSSKMGRPFTNEEHYERFLQSFGESEKQGLSLPVKTRKATQAAFLCFLENEFSTPAYLAKGIEQASRDTKDLGPWLRALPDSFLLKKDFLAQLCRVGETAVYLDEEGMDRTRRLFLDKLPSAVTKLQPKPKGPAATPR